MIADSTLQTADFAGSSIVSSRILDGSISAVDFATGSATLTKLAADSVNGAKIASGSVSTADFSTSGISLTDLTVTGVLTASGSIIAGQTPLTFDGSSVGGTSLIFSITSPTSSRTITFPDQSGTIVLIGSTSTVSSNMIVDGTLATVDFLNDCVTKAKINPNFAGSGIDQNVDGSLELAANWMSLVSFSTAEAGAGLTITTGEMHLAVDAVGIVLNGNTLELGASGVTTAKLGTDSVTTAKIAAGAVSNIQIANDVAGVGIVRNSGDKSLEVDLYATHFELNLNKIRVKDLAIVNAMLADDCATTETIRSNAILATKFADNSVTKAKVTSFAGTGLYEAVDGQIGVTDGEISTVRMQDGCVETTEILDGTLATADFTTTGITIDDLSMTGHVTFTAQVAGSSPLVFRPASG
eukprot:116753_1